MNVSGKLFPIRRIAVEKPPTIEIVVLYANGHPNEPVLALIVPYFTICPVQTLPEMKKMAECGSGFPSSISRVIEQTQRQPAMGDPIFQSQRLAGSFAPRRGTRPFSSLPLPHKPASAHSGRSEWVSTFWNIFVSRPLPRDRSVAAALSGTG